MGIMTGGGVVCQTAAKKCEVKLERLATSTVNGNSSSSNSNNSNNSTMSNNTDSSKFKRPLSSSSIKNDHDDDLRPPVKLKVKIGGNGRSGSPCLVVPPQSAISKYANTEKKLPPPTTRNTAAQMTTRTNTARGASGGPMKPAGATPPPSAAPVKKESTPYKPLPIPPTFDLELDSTQLKEAIAKLGYDPHGKIPTSLLVRPKANSSIPEPPTRPAVSLTDKEMLPSTPCVYVQNSQEAFSPQLLDICLKRPIVLVRNLANACGMDLGLYTTKKLVEMHPNHPVEIRSQMEQTSDENWDSNMEQPVWYCTSSRSHTTVAKYAEYQAETIKEHYEKSDDKTANPKYDFSGQDTRRMIKFGTNCDLSDEKKWSPQLQELNKLPAWARVVSAGNMLSHIGNQILGMNTVQLYMKVPCARTPGHQENNNFCAVNINIGPGDSEWFGVPNDYWGALQNLCAGNKVDYLHGSWWPRLEELKAAGIPCYRFMQRPGDLVWVNVGCVHWVQASGWCNNIAWNVGPMTERQLVFALERYEWNKSQQYQSIVAMGLLTWNLARNLRITNAGLYREIRKVLQQSLRVSMQTQAFVRDKGLTVRFHGRRKNEPAHYCGICDEEVFNNLFIKENEKKYVVHCIRCSLEMDKNLKNFICLEEYSEEDLLKTYDDFILYSEDQAKTPQSGLGYCEETAKTPALS